MAETENVQTEQAVEESSEKIQAQVAEFEEAVDSGSSGENLNILLDIQMPISVVLGKTKVPFRRLLQLGPGSVLELDKAVGQPADLYVQDIQLASGDIVVIDDSYGIRIREVIAGESIQNLKIPANAPSAKKG